MVKRSGQKLWDFHLMECPGDCCKATIQSCCHIHQAQSLIVAARKIRESFPLGNNFYRIATSRFLGSEIFGKGSSQSALSLHNPVESWGTLQTRLLFETRNCTVVFVQLPFEKQTSFFAVPLASLTSVLANDKQFYAGHAGLLHEVSPLSEVSLG